MGETSNFYEKCSSLSKKGDEKSLRTLLQMGISGNKTARVALRKTRNKKLLKTLIDEYLDNIPSEYNAGMILNLAVKVLRKEYLYVYLMEIFHEKKDLKEIGFFKSVKDIPLDKQEQIEVKKYIIDTKDFDIRLISLIAVEEREDILYALLEFELNNIDGDDVDLIKNIYNRYCDLLDSSSNHISFDYYETVHGSIGEYKSKKWRNVRCRYYYNVIWRFVLKICVIVLPVGLYWICGVL